MQAYRVETTIAPDGSLTINHLPLPVGATVDQLARDAVELERLSEKVWLRPRPVTTHHNSDDNRAFAFLRSYLHLCAN